MTIDKSIFGLRFGTNETLSPTSEELGAFLDLPKKQGVSKPHHEDLARYTELLERIKDFDRRGTGTTTRNLRERIFLGVLAHSRFISPALKHEVEQFKYHLHTLTTLDFKKPSAFIKSAEQEIGRLNPKKKEDAARIDRLKSLVEERKKTLEALKKRWQALSLELGDIAYYIRDNLVKIEKLCETSIVVLVELQISRKKEDQLVEDIKTEFKERVKDALHAGGAVTKEYLGTIKREVDRLTGRLPVLLREDLYAVTGLFESIHDHARETVREIGPLADKVENRKSRDFDEDRELFAQIERALVSLVSDFHFELPPEKTHDNTTAHEDILMEKRKAMTDHIFELLKKERRTRDDRRSLEDRRAARVPAREGPERRTGKERRTHHRRE